MVIWVPNEALRKLVEDLQVRTDQKTPPEVVVAALLVYQVVVEDSEQDGEIFKQLEKKQRAGAMKRKRKLRLAAIDAKRRKPKR